VIKIMEIQKIESLPTRSTGVYLITCKTNGKFYVGSSTVCLRRRCRSHQTNLKNGKHDNSLLQKNWNKYGAESFLYTVLELCEKDKCIEREQFWIDKLDATNRHIALNLAPIAGSVSGYRFTFESRRLKSIQTKNLWSDHKYRSLVSSSIAKSHANDNFKDNQRIKANKQWECPLARKAQSQRATLQMSDPDMRKLQSTNHKRWHTENPHIATNHSKHLKEYYRKNQPPNVRRVDQFDQNQTIVASFDSMVAAGKSIGVSNCAIYNAIKRNTMSGGYYWKYTI